MSFGLLLLHNYVKYVGDKVLLNAPLREHHILMSTISIDIVMSSMRSVLSPRCGSRRHPPIPTPSVEVEPITGFEIEEASMSSSLAPRLESDIKP